MNLCKYCNFNATHQFKNGVYCCEINIGKCPKIKEQRKSTIIEKYGVDNISKLQDIKDIKDKTFHKNYPKDSIARNKLIKTKQDAWAEKDLDSINLKRKESCIEKYGVDNPLKVDSIAASVSTKNRNNSSDRIAKGRKTIQERYGVDYISQIPSVHEKQQKYKWKDYVMPSGAILRIQGYENKALDILLRDYKEVEIIIDRKILPEIWYNFNNKNRKYFPDIFIPKENLIIEVKSKWTFSVKKEQHYAKRDACLYKGYNFKFWMFDEQDNFWEE